MKHIHIQIAPNAIATFSEEPSQELLDALQKMVEVAKANLPELQVKNEGIRESEKKVCSKCGCESYTRTLGRKEICQRCGEDW